MRKHYTPNNRRGFTLVELLTVVAIIGILAGILIPVVGGAKKNALKAKSKAQFSGWASALEAYKNEYGYYPRLGSGSGLNGGSTLNVSSDHDNFIMALSGRSPDGDRLSSTQRDNANRKAIGFYSFGASEFGEEGTPSEGQLSDAFGNEDIYIKVDHDGNGVIEMSGENLPSDLEVTDSGSNLRARVAIWTLEEDGDGFENIATWK